MKTATSLHTTCVRAIEGIENNRSIREVALVQRTTGLSRGDQFTREGQDYSVVSIDGEYAHLRISKDGVSA